MFNKLKINLVFIFIFFVIQSFFLSLGIYSAKMIFDYLIKNEIKLFWIWISLEIFSFACFIFLECISNFLVDKLSSKALINLQKQYYENNDFIMLVGQNRSNQINEILDNSEIILNDNIKGKIILLQKIIYIIGLLFVSVIFNWILIMAIILILVLGKIILHFLEKINSKNLIEINNKNEKYYFKVIEILDTIKLFLFNNWLNLFTKRIISNTQNFQNSKRKNIIKSIRIDFLSSLFIFFFQLSIIFTTGILYFYSFINLGVFIAINSLLSFLFDYSFEFFDLIIRIKSSKNLLNFWIYKTKNLDETNEVEQIKNITFKNVSLHKEGRIILGNINLVFEDKKKYLIKGKSGSGKTSLLNLMYKLENNYFGEILVNEKNIKTIKTNSLRKNFLFSTNEFYLLNDNLEKNISLLEDISTNELKVIKERANIDFSNIEGISTGQQQRIQFARILYSNLNWIIIDESFSNLDRENFLKIEKELLSLENKTIIHVSHNKYTENIDLYDEIIEL